LDLEAVCNDSSEQQLTQKKNGIMVEWFVVNEQKKMNVILFCFSCF